MKTIFRIILAAVLTLPALAYPTSHSTSVSAKSATDTLTSGEIRKIDKDAKKLTIRHGPIENLGMPPMTMVFQVRDARLLDSLKTGDKVKFAADKIDGAYTATHIELEKQ